jgi:hypothetical protein
MAISGLWLASFGGGSGGDVDGGDVDGDDGGGGGEWLLLSMQIDSPL